MDGSGGLHAAGGAYGRERAAVSAVINVAPGAVVRAADWMLRGDCSGGELIVEAECTSCPEASGGADDGNEPAVWCLRHAQETGHTGFRRIRTDFFRASLYRPEGGVHDADA